MITSHWKVERSPSLCRLLAQICELVWRSAVPGILCPAAWLRWHLASMPFLVGTVQENWLIAKLNTTKSSKSQLSVKNEFILMQTDILRTLSGLPWEGGVMLVWFSVQQCWQKAKSVESSSFQDSTQAVYTCSQGNHVRIDHNTAGAIFLTLNVGNVSWATTPSCW